MIEVRLPIEEWNRVLAILARAPWAEANPLIMALGDQLRAQASSRMPSDGAGEPAPPTTRQ
jgi:hypothetical protein